MPGSQSLSEAVAQREALKTAWNKKDLKKCKLELNKAKIALTEIQFLPTAEAATHKEELHVARDILEFGADVSIAEQDVDAFERYIAQLKTYYTDYAGLIPESEKKYELLGLNLLCLLSKNKIADFHTELEQLPTDIMQSSVYIQSPVRLEQFIMEGSYNKVIMMKDNVPAPSYSFFINKLLNTIRDEIASCMEKAYEGISLTECSKMLQLDAAATKQLIAQRKWSVDPKSQRVSFTDGSEKKLAEEIATEELAKMSITYAREMEQIV